MLTTLQERGADPRDTTGLVGLDSGQGSLKVALTLVNHEGAEEDKERAKYSQVPYCGGWGASSQIYYCRV